MTYTVSPTIKYKDWKRLCDDISDSGPTGISFDTVLWHMLRDEQIKIYIDTDLKDDPIIISLK